MEKVRQGEGLFVTGGRRPRVDHGGGFSSSVPPPLPRPCTEQGGVGGGGTTCSSAPLAPPLHGAGWGDYLLLTPPTPTRLSVSVQIPTRLLV